MQCAGSGDRTPYRVTDCDLHCISTSDAWLSIGLQICKPIPRPRAIRQADLSYFANSDLLSERWLVVPRQNREIEVVALEQMGECLC